MMLLLWHGKSFKRLLSYVSGAHGSHSIVHSYIVKDSIVVFGVVLVELVRRS